MPNPNEYLAKESLLALKQDKLVAGDNITIDPITNRISAQTGAGTVTDVKVDNISVVNASGIANVDLSGKQNTLTPGTNITIQNNVISATGGTEVEANPADPATDTLSTVDIDGTVYEVGNGNTNYTELTQAQYDALTPEEKSNGELYFITDGQNSSIIPNPQDTPTDTLNTIKIDDTVYDIAGSGGGTTVVANPQGTPTDDLETIQIGNTIYDITGGGGGGGDEYSEKTLFEQPYNTAFPSTITLSESFENFDALGLYLTKSDDTSYYDYLPVKIFMKSALTEALNGAISGRPNTLCVTGWQHSNNSQFARFQVDSTTQLTIPVSGGAWNLKKITGIKFGSSSSGSGDGGYFSTLLWDYITDNTGTIPYGTYSVTLNDNINNYDFLLVENVSISGDLNNVNWNGTNQYLINVDALNNAYNQGYYNYTSFGERSSRFYIHDTTFSKTIDNQGSTNGLVKVYGLKFGGTAVTETTLWTGTIDSIGDTGVLNKPLGDYDYLLMYGDVSSKVGEHHIDCLDARMLKESLDNGDEPYFSYEYYDTQFLRCRFSDETHFSCTEFNNCDFHYRKIVGIKINDASGGGTNVEANPVDTPTDTLETIKIGDTVFNIAGSGGGGNVDDVYVNGESVLDSNHIAQVQSYKKLTQAEYDALPASKLTDGILYCISDSGIVEGDQFAPIIYSLDEREVGTWTDGKPLYQRTFDLRNVTYTNRSWNRNILGTSGISIKNFKGLIGLDNAELFAEYNYYRATDEYVTTYNIGTDLQTYPAISSGTWHGGVITIWYTKDIDTPGSAQYNSLGVPMVHYSTDEQIVGTWIDGKTIYQKTCNVTTNTNCNNTTWSSLPLDNPPTNADYMVDAELHGQCPNTNRIYRFQFENGAVKIASSTSEYILANTKITFRYTKSSS